MNERMRTHALISTAAGALAGCAALALAAWWTRELCLPLSAGEVKWQCAVRPWAIGAAYFAAAFVAAALARRRGIAVAAAAFVLLFAAHGLAPQLALVSFGKRWYAAEPALLLALVPALAGLAGAMLARRTKR